MTFAKVAGLLEEGDAKGIVEWVRANVPAD